MVKYNLWAGLLIILAVFMAVLVVGGMRGAPIPVEEQYFSEIEGYEELKKLRVQNLAAVSFKNLIQSVGQQQEVYDTFRYKLTLANADFITAIQKARLECVNTLLAIRETEHSLSLLAKADGSAEVERNTNSQNLCSEEIKIVEIMLPNLKEGQIKVDFSAVKTSTASTQEESHENNK